MIGARNQIKELEAFESIRIYQSVQRDRWQFPAPPDRMLRISLGWRQFQFEQDEVTVRRLEK